MYIKKITTAFFILVFFQSSINAQIEDNYHSFSGNIYVPIIVDHQEITKFKDGREIEKNIPDKEVSMSFYINSKTMQVNRGVFSGLVVNDLGAAHDEVITYRGKVSSDKQKIEYIELTKESVAYVLDTREDIEKTTSINVRFENIPRSPYGSGYKYKYGVSKIASVAFNEVYSIPRSHYVNSYTEDFVKVDEEKLNKYYKGVQAKFEPGVSKSELKDEAKITVLVYSGENQGVSGGLMNGVVGILNPLLNAIDGLIVLETVHIDHLEDEIGLSQSGLVQEDTAVHTGRILDSDVQIILSAEDRKPEDISSQMKQFTLRSKIKIVETGNILDPNLTYIIKEGKGFIGIEDYFSNVIDCAIHFLFK